MALCLLLLLGGCAASGPPANGSAESSRAEGPRVRCLNDPAREPGTRPIFFLFCVESP